MGHISTAASQPENSFVDEGEFRPQQLPHQLHAF
jgi:hypothetical protein